MQASKYTKLLNNKWFRRGACIFTASSLVGVVAVSLSYTPASATELLLHPPKYPWYHHKMLHSLDHASLRRGYQVYKQVCAACHGIREVSYRHLIDVIFTREEAAKEAQEVNVTDGPNDDGDMYERPGILGDYFPSPYRNDEEGAKANGGAAPPDFSYIVASKKEREDYVFQLLTGYCDAPAGKVIEEGQYYNPYFPGGVLAMPRPLYNEMIEYEDGTPATTSQMAKDVTTFLTWVSEPTHDERKFIGIRVVSVTFIFFLISYYMKRKCWSYYYSMQRVYKNRKPPKVI